MLSLTTSKSWRGVLIMTGLLLCLSAQTVSAKRNSTALVVTATVEQASVTEEIPLSGTVSSPQLAKLSSEVSGLVKSVLVDAGSHVKSGDILVTLNTELETLSLQASQAITARSREELADARRRLLDAKRLAKKKTISVNELQSLEAEVNIAKASLQRYMAEERLQKARLQRHEIKAPFGGVISEKYVTSGEWIQPGTAVARLVATKDLRIDFQLPQQVYPRVNLSAKINIQFDALPNQILTGKIQTIIPFSDSNARTFLMRVTLPQANLNIAPGMSASGILLLQNSESGIIVSRDALVRYPDGRITVWIVTSKEGKAVVTERHVKTGLTFNGMVEILDGLEVGERVVLEGNEALRNGQTVQVQ